MNTTSVVVVAAGALLTVNASIASAQMSPVRSSVDAESSINLSVVGLSDVQSAVDDQGVTTNALGPISAPVLIESADGVFTGNSSGSATFADAASGTFAATLTYDGNQTASMPTAQSFGHNMSSVFEYDFTLPGDGSVRFQGILENSGPSFIGFTTRVRVFSEFMPGSGFTGAFFEQLFTDDVSSGSTAFDVAVPLEAASGSYRVQIRLEHSGTGVLDTDIELGATMVDWTITAPDACPADTNGDGALTPADFNAWIIAFNTQSPSCDQNGDGMCTPSDFNAWVLNYNSGC